MTTDLVEYISTTIQKMLVSASLFRLSFLVSAEWLGWKLHGPQTDSVALASAALRIQILMTVGGDLHFQPEGQQLSCEMFAHPNVRRFHAAC